MGMLGRIKKRQFDGFKEFVQNMEITGIQSRTQIFTAGVLEDPLYMGWVMKNIRTFDDFIKLPSEEIEAVLMGQEQMMSLFAKSLFDAKESTIMDLESSLPRLMSKFKDELSYLKEVTPQERDSARYYILKTARKLQSEEIIHGFHWNLPPQDVFFNKTFKDGVGQIFFESGILAAEGEFQKGRRIGYWKHNYDSGKLLAEGEYFDGLKSGTWVFYYGNGNIKAQGKYYNDLKHGLWKEWDRRGNLSEVEYKEGVKV